MIYDYTTLQDILYHRKKSDRDYYTLRLDEFTGHDGVTKSSVFFGSTSQEWFYMATAHTRLRQLNLIFSKKWLEDYFSNEISGEILTNHVTLKSPFVVFEVMDTEYKRLMTEILNVHQDKQFEQMVIQNRVALIIERFFSRVYKGIEVVNHVPKISSRELRNIKQVEVELLKDFSRQPPGIAQLSRTAGMSPSKMKILFKEVFGLPVNQYFQKHRMNKAKAMLLSKKYSVKEVAGELGFASISTFRKAFQKTFDELPAEIAPLK
jgi:AraC-like DNA-binding protein